MAQLTPEARDALVAAVEAAFRLHTAPHSAEELKAAGMPDWPQEPHLVRFVVIGDMVGPNSRSLARVALSRDGSDLVPWESEGILLHSLKEVLFP